MPISIGIDFDNTIVSYEGVFHSVAFERNLIPADLSFSKGAIRDYFRSIGKEELWTELQGYVYGAKMDSAHPYPTALSFFALCVEKKISTYIISHKTRHPYLGHPYDLHQSAKEWLKGHGFLAPAFFELTLEAKFKRIEQQKCEVFIDDLPEVLEHADFPKGIRRILFNPHLRSQPSDHYESVNHWEDVIKILQLNQMKR